MAEVGPSTAPNEAPETVEGSADTDLGHFKSPEAKRRALANLRPAWKPGQSGNPAGRKPGESFTEVVRKMMEGRIPPKLRDKVSRKLGIPLHALDEMNNYDLLAACMFFEYIEKGKFDQAQALLDRVDPKSRRVDIDGEVRHKHAHLQLTAGMDEQQAADLYREALGTGTVVDVEPVPPAASDGQPVE